jgi:hypothetical protein
MTRKKISNETIFVQIASYRDPELLPTIKDCLNNAKYPENLRICVAWQHSGEDVWDTLDEFKDDPRFRIVDVDYLKSQGACWARHTIHEQYGGEDYYLQLDSHHRFIKSWDTECIKMIKQLQKKGHKKPLLTGYISSFNPDNDPAERMQEPWWMTFDRFIPEGAIFFLPATIPNWQKLKAPIPSRFLSAHFIFTFIPQGTPVAKCSAKRQSCASSSEVRAGRSLTAHNMRAVLSSRAALEDKPPPSGSVVDTDPEKPRSTFRSAATPETYRPHAGMVEVGSTTGSAQCSSIG